MADLQLAVSQSTAKVWAKFDEKTSDWFPLHAHLEDTAAVAERLFKTWLSPSQRALLADAFGSEDTARRLSVWLAAAHDVGKATSAFAMKVPSRRSPMERAGFVFPQPDPPLDEQRRYPHGLAGQRAVASFLQPKAAEKSGRRTARRIAEIIGGHHGVFPENTRAPFHFSEGEDPSWGKAREELLNRADHIAGLDDGLWARILNAHLTETVQAILTGFLIVCDWIASDHYLFPYDFHKSADERATSALRKLDFGEHWNPSGIEDVDEYFRDRFGIDSPRPVQNAAVDVAAAIEEPSLMLIEAPTGEGKTEMGFACAETLAAKFGLQGAMVALPTRATTNAMFGRALQWLEASADGANPVSVSLAHSKAQFDDRFQSLFAHARPGRMYGGDSESDYSVVVNQWTVARKRNVFADFVIATIDQALFMTLKAKHLALRHLGFSSKVVIIDEVHASDDFMRTYLLRALQWFGAYGVPVIALSATLPPAQRQQLLHAYRQGAQQGRRNIAEAGSFIDEDAPVDEEVSNLAAALEYPLITAVGAEHIHQVAPPRSGRRRSYALKEVDDENLVDRVLEEAEAGGCIAVVLNTVNRAQEFYGRLRERCSGEIALFHSRFTVESRNQREQELIDRLGPDSTNRPQSMIVVATQVVESSLDVDFDLMFTDIAPMDLLIQRIGRVHRHARPASERPASMREARIVLSGGSGLLSGESPPVFDDGVVKVYGDSLLLRTTAALRVNCERTGRVGIEVPEDVPELIRSAYQTTPISLPGWESRQEAAEAERDSFIRDQKDRSEEFVIGFPGEGNIARWSSFAYQEASEEARGGAQVRDAELSLEVVVVQRLGGSHYSLPWLPDPHGGAAVDFMTEIPEDDARMVATCTLSLPSWMTRGAGLDGVLDDLERNGIEAWQRSIWLRGMLPLVLDEDLRTVVNGHRLRYDREVGLVLEGKDEE